MDIPQIARRIPAELRLSLESLMMKLAIDRGRAGNDSSLQSSQNWMKVLKSALYARMDAYA